MRGGIAAVVGVGLLTVLLTPMGTLAQRRGDWYHDVRPYVGKESESSLRKVRLMEEVFQLRAVVRRLDRRGEITPRQADRFHARLDRVAHFVRNDRNLTASEFERRRRDLDGIAQDLHQVTRVRPVLRDDPRYGRGAPRCHVCDGVCRYR